MKRVTLYMNKAVLYINKVELNVCTVHEERLNVQYIQYSKILDEVFVVLS